MGAPSAPPAANAAEFKVFVYMDEPTLGRLYVMNLNDGGMNAAVVGSDTLEARLAELGDTPAIFLIDGGVIGKTNEMAAKILERGKTLIRVLTTSTGIPEDLMPIVIRKGVDTDVAGFVRIVSETGSAPTRRGVAAEPDPS